MVAVGLDELLDEAPFGDQLLSLVRPSRAVARVRRVGALLEVTLELLLLGTLALDPRARSVVLAGACGAAERVAGPERDLRQPSSTHDARVHPVNGTPPAGCEPAEAWSPLRRRIAGESTYNFTLFSCTLECGSFCTPPDALPELFQTEWCPPSRRVRQRLTELGVAGDRPGPRGARGAHGAAGAPVSRRSRRSSTRRRVHVGERHLAHLDISLSRAARARKRTAQGDQARERELKEAHDGWNRLRTDRHDALSAEAASIASAMSSRPKGSACLCEIDVQATLQAKLGVDGEPYVILGAATPTSRAARCRPSPTLACCSRATSSSTSARCDPRLGDRRRADALDRRDDTCGLVAAEVRDRLARVVPRHRLTPHRSACGAARALPSH